MTLKTVKSLAFMFLVGAVVTTGALLRAEGMSFDQFVSTYDLSWEPTDNGLEGTVWGGPDWPNECYTQGFNDDLVSACQDYCDSGDINFGGTGSDGCDVSCACAIID